MGKKNLDSILIKKESILPEKVEGSLLNKDKNNPKKRIKERDSEILSIKITPTEMANLVKKKEKEAGRMAPLSTFLKDYLRTKTDIFSSS